MNSAGILLIEDEIVVSNMIKAGLQQHSAIVTLATSLSAALHILKGLKFDAIILDLNLPDSKGKDTINAIQKAAPLVPIVVITGDDNACTFCEAIHSGAQDFLIKGQFKFIELVRAIRYAIERHKVRKLFIPIEQDIRESEKLLEKLKETINIKE